MIARRLRQSTRAVLLDADDRILLARFVVPGGDIWATPGGGLDDGESDEVGLRRELAEELGLDELEIGPLVWVRDDQLPSPLGTFDAQLERYYLVRTARFEPQPRVDLAAENVGELRWWTAGEIAASMELFAPSRLAHLLRDLLENGAPPEPIDAGV